jgi:HSP20 family molecular chaperone IbpA
VDPKDVKVSLMDNVLTVTGERQADFALPEGVDAAHVEAKYARGMLEVRVPTPQAATPRMIEVKAA